MTLEQVLGTILGLVVIIIVLLIRLRHRKPPTAQKADESIEDIWHPIPPVKQTVDKEPLTVEDFRTVAASSYRMKPLLKPIEGYALPGADLSGINLSRLRLERCNLRAANLANANLQDAELVSMNLAAANLQGANLTHASLQNPSLSGASLQSALLLGAVLVTVEKRELESADLTDAKYDFLTDWPLFFDPDRHNALSVDGLGPRSWSLCSMDSMGHGMRRRVKRVYAIAAAKSSAGADAKPRSEVREKLTRILAPEHEIARSDWKWGWLSASFHQYLGELYEHMSMDDYYYHAANDIVYWRIHGISAYWKIHGDSIDPSSTAVLTKVALRRYTCAWEDFLLL